MRIAPPTLETVTTLWPSPRLGAVDRKHAPWQRCVVDDGWIEIVGDEVEVVASEDDEVVEIEEVVEAGEVEALDEDDILVVSIDAFDEDTGGRSDDLRHFSPMSDLEIADLVDACTRELCRGPARRTERHRPVTGRNATLRRGS